MKKTLRRSPSDRAATKPRPRRTLRRPPPSRPAPRAPRRPRADPPRRLQRRPYRPWRFRQRRACRAVREQCKAVCRRPSTAACRASATWSCARKPSKPARPPASSPSLKTRRAFAAQEQVEQGSRRNRRVERGRGGLFVGDGKCPSEIFTSSPPVLRAAAQWVRETPKILCVLTSPSDFSVNSSPRPTSRRRVKELGPGWRLRLLRCAGAGECRGRALRACDTNR